MKNTSLPTSASARRTGAKSSKSAVASTRSSSASAPRVVAKSSARPPDASKDASAQIAASKVEAPKKRAAKTEAAKAVLPQVATAKGAALVKQSRCATSQTNSAAPQNAAVPTCKATRHNAKTTSPAHIEKVAATKTRSAKAVKDKSEAAPRKTVSQTVAKPRATANARRGGAAKIVAHGSDTKSSAKKPVGGKAQNAATAPRRVSASSSRTSIEKTRAATAEPSLENATPVKAKRAKLPADFAAQYARETKPKTPLVPLAAPKKPGRRSAAQRENLRRALMPDDDFLQRLARAGAIASSADVPALRRPSTPRRSRKWESRCGKCGVNSTFSTPASLCARCGTIVVRAE